MTSRLIVKNLPKHLKEVDLAKHFESNKALDCTVTDAKIMTKNNRSRLFGFVGFKNEEQAEKALKYFNNTFLHTSRISVEAAKAQGDETLARPWSKHSMGSSAFQRKNPTVENPKRKREQKSEVKSEEVEEKKRKFREFLGLNLKHGDQKQSWNDTFVDFMAQPLQKKTAKKQKTEEPNQQESTGEQAESEQVLKKTENEIADDKRLFVMNLSYQVTKEELQGLFGKYGQIDDIEIPFRKGGKGVPLGIAFVKFSVSESAIQAFAELDQTYFQGRKLHIKPAEKKPPKAEEPPREFKPRREDEEQRPKESNYKKEKEQILKTNFDDETNWNYLYMNQDTVASSMAKQLNLQKSQFFDKDQKESMAVKLASSETLIISQTKAWLKEHCLLDFDKVDRRKCKRSHKILLVKNIAASVKEHELREIFERYGALQRLLVSPFNTLAIVEYGQETQAEAAFRNLAYYKINYLSPIYLEYAPEGTLSPVQQAVAEDENTNVDVQERQQRQVFVKNLNFETREEQLEKMLNEASLSFKAVKIIRRSDTQQSRGYGFIEVESQLAAENVVKKLQNYMIDDHALKLSLSTKAMTQVEQEKQKAKVLKKRTHAETQESKVDNDDVTSQKLLVKNLAFECTADEIRELFKGYGSLKKVRLPKKANSSNHRGFGFVEFTTKEEAKAAFKQMQDTHLYGRKLVIEYAKLDKGADAE